MKLYEILAMAKGMNDIMNKKLPIEASYKIMKNSKLINDEIEYIEKTRLGILNEYCDKDEDGKPIYGCAGEFLFSNTENRETVNNKLSELMNMESDISFVKMRVGALLNYDSSKYDALTPNELSCLNPMFDDDKNVKED